MTTATTTIEIDALALLDEYRERLDKSREGEYPQAAFTATEQQYVGVMHFLTDLLVEAGGNRTAISDEYGFGRLAREEREAHAR